MLKRSLPLCVLSNQIDINKKSYKINTKKKILKESQCLYKYAAKQYTYMHQVFYNNKLEHQCTLVLLYPKVIYIGIIQAKGYLYFRYTCPNTYSYLSILCELCLAAYSDARHLSVLYSVK